MRIVLSGSSLQDSDVSDSVLHWLNSSKSGRHLVHKPRSAQPTSSGAEPQSNVFYILD
ncbi:hypothetical protein DPMN_036205 [Dreissena polymorpha]|uniref:Uncharacterized protein n=1 Tax=Dreissena polymorpha TaxID=45954 RepID=A0A9D4MD80_DREPO|nr:hypothetical protein DPMN_036205 [Dreissena polymorpha]